MIKQQVQPKKSDSDFLGIKAIDVKNTLINLQNDSKMLFIMYISMIVLIVCIIFIHFLDSTRSTAGEYASNIMSIIIVGIICLRIFMIYPNMTYFNIDNQMRLFYECIGIISVFAVLLIFYFMTNTNTAAQWGLTIATILIVFVYLIHLLKVTNKMFPNVDQKIVDVSKAYKYVIILILFLSFVFTFYFSNFQKNPTTSLIIVSVLCGLYVAYIARYMYDKLFSSLMASVGLICTMLVFLYNPYGIVSQLSSIMIFGVIFIVISLIIAITYYFGLYSSGDTPENLKLITSFRNVSMFVVGLGVFCSIIAYLVTTFDTKTGGTGKLIINILILTGMLSIIFNALNNSGFVQSHPSLRLIVNTILYIPCLLTNLLELFTKEYYLTTSPTVILIIVEILLVCIYFAYPYVVNKIYVTSNGKLLINEPYDLSKPNNVSSYDELNTNSNIHLTNKYSDSDNKPIPTTPPLSAQSYKYSLSCWVFINSVSPSTNKNYASYITILDYGQKPSILFNPLKNELIVTSLENKTLGGEIPTKNANTYTEAPSDYTVVYKNSNIPLQKWNNIVLNVDGGTLDVFFNGELVQSSINITPNITQDILTVGSNDGLSGGICNLEYFEEPLNIININYLYNLLKNSDPPIVPSKLKLFDYKI